MRRGSLLILCAALAGVIAVVVLMQRQPSAESLLQLAQAALHDKDLDTALKLSQQALERDPQSIPAMLNCAQVCEQLHDSAAIDYYNRVPDSAPEAALARTRAGDLRLQQHHDLSGAEALFRRALAIDSDRLLAHDRLAYILGLSGRDWEHIPHQIEVLRSGDLNRARLYSLSLGDRLPTDPKVIGEYAERAPDDPLVLAGQALVAIAGQRRDDAIALLERAVAQNPELIALRLRLGELYLDGAAAERFVRWHAELPAAAADYPRLWVIRGRHARQTGQLEAAARCFWEALRLDPNHQQANYQLGQLLVAMGRTADAEPFLERSRRIEEYVQLVFANTFTDLGNPRALRGCEQTAASAAALGLAWEAWAWRSIVERHPSMSGGNPFLHRAEGVTPPPRELTARCDPQSNPARRLDLSQFPLPTWSLPDSSSPEQPTAVTDVSFVDRAADSGLVFTYFDAADPATQGKRIFDSIGGGVAVLDFDLDGWPDVYATQRCPWPVDPFQQSSLDALFRSRGGRSFQEVSAVANVFENGYSQGATVGDFNDDGFPDLYVANIGPNRLYANNGDGTFDDVTAPSAAGGDDWSTSCVLADLNADALPDLYVVNYVATTGGFERVCTAPDGSATTCPPRAFAAAADRLYLNLGDGRFEELSRDAGLTTDEGRGLGVVAADLDDSGRLSLFVANDQDPNFLLVNQADAGSATPRFIDEALANGVALSGDGRAQACMGIAVGDAHGDGRLDLFVTNFTEETNTLYKGIGQRLFVDDTAPAQLAEPSFQLLGFGTQFIDGDHDGRLDLIVANGHIDDRSRRGELYRMPPQFFSNRGAGRFTEARAESLGPYFAGRYLGRALARLDWNRDGLDDVAVSHLDAPLALLSNTTAEHGHFVALRLCGTVSSRDAIGASVTIKSGPLTLVHQLTAGDGFQASNERQLNIGLGARTQIDEVHVRWPSGRQQTFTNLPADRRSLLVEGRAAPLPLDRE